MALPISFYGQKINDNTVKSNGTPESTSWQVPITTLTAANLTAKEALIGALATAVLAIQIGNLAQTTITLDRQLVSVDPAGSALAQRENKWLLRYHTNSPFKKFDVSIGCADLTLLSGHSEFLALGSGVGADLKSAFEAIVTSPDDSSLSVVLDSVQFVGRNS